VPKVLFEFRKQAGYEKSTVGIGVPYLPASEPGLGPFLAGKPVPPPPFAPELVSFGDHVYEFAAEPAGCTVRIEAAEATPAHLQTLASGIADPSDPDYPACLDHDDPTHPCYTLPAGAAEPVLYLGENGRGILYEVLPDPDVIPNPCYAPEVDLFRHAINAYAGYVPNRGWSAAHRRATDMTAC